MPRGCCVVCIYSFLLKIFELLTVLVSRTMVLSVHTSYSWKLWLSYLTCNRDFTDADKGTGREVGRPRHQLGPVWSRTSGAWRAVPAVAEKGVFTEAVQSDAAQLKYFPQLYWGMIDK